MATTARTGQITGHIGPNWSQEVFEFVEGRAWNVRFPRVEYTRLADELGLRAMTSIPLRLNFGGNRQSYHQ